MRVEPARDGERGSIFVEFLIVTTPLFLTIFGLIQWLLMLSAAGIVRHAAVRAARSAAVVLDDVPDRYEGVPRLAAEGARLETIRAAAVSALVAATPAEPWHAATATAVSLPRDRFAAGDDVTVRVHYRFPCHVPLARHVLCRDGFSVMEAEATLPLHAASYPYAGAPR